MLRLLLLLVLTCQYVDITAQTHTRSLGTSPSPPAQLSDVSWLAGHWIGEGMGQTVEEIWTPPLGRSMMGAFKMMDGDEIVFYELCIIMEHEGSLLFRLKHFTDELKGWDEKDQTVDFPLVEIAKDVVYFDGLTLKRISEDELHIYVVIGHDDGTTEETLFSYLRYNK